MLRLQVECPNIAAVPENLAAVDIEKMRFSQAHNLSLFTVEKSVVEDLFQLILFELTDSASSSIVSPFMSLRRRSSQWLGRGRGRWHYAYPSTALMLALVWKL